MANAARSMAVLLRSACWRSLPPSSDVAAAIAAVIPSKRNRRRHPKRGPNPDRARLRLARAREVNENE